MLEKIINLDQVSLVDFLGVENRNIESLAKAFPDSKIVSRGDELKIIGRPPEIYRINAIVESLLAHYNRFGKLTPENVADFLGEGEGDSTDEATMARIGESSNTLMAYGRSGKPLRVRSKNQQKLVDAIRQNDLTFAIGPAGTGKTFIAVAMAVQALKSKEVRKLIITRPAVEAGENLGFLPGDLKEKIDPYLRPIYDSLEELLPAEKLSYYMSSGVIEVAPLAYMRGRTLNEAFVLLDEAQNTTSMQLKMFLTRMGANSKMVVTGDISQVDLPPKQQSGLLIAKKLLVDVPGMAFIELEGADVVRHPLVREVIKAYDRWEENK